MKTVGLFLPSDAAMRLSTQIERIRTLASNGPLRDLADQALETLQSGDVGELQVWPIGPTAQCGICPLCDGKGKRLVRVPPYGPTDPLQEVECGDCYGTGVRDGQRSDLMTYAANLARAQARQMGVKTIADQPENN